MRSPRHWARRVPGMCCLALLGLALAGCQSAPIADQRSAAPPTQPAVVSKTVWVGHYAQDIQSIFDQNCISCHGKARADNGLRLDSYEGAMKGTQHGPVIVPGSPSRSTLMSALEGSVDPTIRMPHGEKRLTQQELRNLTLWIEAGAPPN